MKIIFSESTNFHDFKDTKFVLRKWERGQTFEQPNLERAIFGEWEIPNIRRTKDELDFINFEFFFLFSYLFESF